MVTGMNKGARLTREMRCVNVISTHPFKARIAFVNWSPFEVEHWLIDHPLKLLHVLLCFLHDVINVFIMFCTSIAMQSYHLIFETIVLLLLAIVIVGTTTLSYECM